MNLRKIMAVAASFVTLTYSSAPGQLASDPNEGARLTRGSSAGVYTFSWWGRAGRTYFLQQSEDLVHWTSLPVIESGADQVIQWGVSSTSDRFFMRLQYSDIATTDPDGADFDGDHVGNYDELLHGTNPLSNHDSDGNGLPDDWQIRYLGQRGNAADGDPDGDGSTNLQEFQQWTDPTDAGVGTVSQGVEFISSYLSWFPDTGGISLDAYFPNQTGPVSKVEFFDITAGARTKLGDAIPFTTFGVYQNAHYAWQNVPAGTRFVIARATDAMGNITVSTPIQIEQVGHLRQVQFDPEPYQSAPAIRFDSPYHVFYKNDPTPVSAEPGSLPPPATVYSVTQGGQSFQWSGAYRYVENYPHDSADTSATGFQTINCVVTQQWFYRSGPNSGSRAPDTSITITDHFSVIDMMIQSDATQSGGFNRRVGTDLFGTFPFTVSVVPASNADFVQINYNNGTIDLNTPNNIRVYQVSQGTRTLVLPGQRFPVTAIPSFEVDTDARNLDPYSPASVYEVSASYLTAYGAVEEWGVYNHDPVALEFRHLVPVILTPRQLPTSGVARASVQFLDYEGFGIIPSTAPTKIMIGGAEATEIQQDNSDPSIFYFTPPPAPNRQTGKFDLEVVGVEFPDQNPTHRTLRDAVEYIDDPLIGMSLFSAGNIVAMNEGLSQTLFNVSDVGLSDDEANYYFSCAGDDNATNAQFLYNSFFADKQFDSFVLQEVECMQRRSDETLLSFPLFTSSPLLGRFSGGGQYWSTEPAEPQDAPPNTDPQLNSPSFFPNVRAYLLATQKKVYYGVSTFGPGLIRFLVFNAFGPGLIRFLVFNADDFRLSAYTTSHPGDTISDAVANTTSLNPEIILNGAQCNFKCRDWLRPADALPGSTIGVVRRDGTLLPTSVNPISNSDIAVFAARRNWFGQTSDTSATANAGRGLTYQFSGARGHPPSSLTTAFGGLTSLIRTVNGAPYLETYADDKDLGTYEVFHWKPHLTNFRSLIPSPGAYCAYNIIGIDRDTGMIIVVTRSNRDLGIVLENVEKALINSGVDEANITDGGDSTALYWKSGHPGQYLSRAGRQVGHPNENNTVTNYILFVPNE